MRLYTFLFFIYLFFFFFQAEDGIRDGTVTGVQTCALPIMLDKDFRVKIVADITCDIDGSVPTTKKPSSITDPLYDYNPITDTTTSPLSDEKLITVMAVDNLPCELPRSASEEFGRDLIDRILKPLLVDDTEGVIDRATIARDGKLTTHFSYLSDYVNSPV